MEEVVVIRAMDEPIRGAVDVGTLRIERCLAQNFSVLLVKKISCSTTSHRFRSISLGQTTTSKNFS